MQFVLEANMSNDGRLIKTSPMLVSNVGNRIYIRFTDESTDKPMQFAVNREELETLLRVI